MQMREQDQHLLQTAEEIGKLLARQYKDDLSVSESQALLDWMHRQSESTQKYMDWICDPSQIEEDLQTLASFDVAGALEDVERMILADVFRGSEQ
jgi:hypothetical protein